MTAVFLQIFLEDAIEMVGYAIEEGSQYAKKLSKRDREDKGQVRVSLKNHKSK